MTAPHPTGPPVLDRRDAAALRFGAALALTGAAVWLLGAFLSVLLPLLTDQGLQRELLLADGGAPAGVGALPEGVRALASDTAALAIDVSVLSDGAVALLLTEAGLSNLVGAIVAGAIAYSLRRIARGDAFHRSMFAVAVVAGCALSIGMMLATGLGGFGRMMAGDELNTLLGSDVLAVGFEFDPLPVLIGFAVLGLAAVFRIGARLQRETDGLV